MTYIGLPVVAKESDAYLLYDVDAKEIMEYAPGIFWPLRKSKALRERGTGNKVVYLGFPLSSSSAKPSGDASGITGTTQMTLKKGDLVQVIGTTEIRKVTRLGETCSPLYAPYVALDSPVKGFKCWAIKDLRVVKGKRCKKP